MKINVVQRNYQILNGKMSMRTLKQTLCGYTVDKPAAYKPEVKRSLLCLIDKYQIIFSKLNLPNSRNELITKCRHENKF